VARLCSILCLLTVFMVLVASPGTTTRAGESARIPAPNVVAKASEHAHPAFTTWAPQEFECPVCKTKNTFMVVMSYGSYIYQWPSKFQLIFWPNTDGAAWYSCKKCRYTRFMGSFEKLPQEKLPALRSLLEGVTLPPQKEIPKEEKSWRQPYTQIPTSDRLLVVEKIEALLGERDDAYWSHFYRVLGYHLSAEKKQSEADEARRKALAVIERQLLDKANDGRRKELLILVGAMSHFLRDDAKAKTNLEQAAKLKYADAKLGEEQNNNYDNYLSELIKEYLEALQKGKGPRDMPDTDN